MKKHTLAFVALATCALGGAKAQSSVTMFGVVDMAVSGYRNTSEARDGFQVSKSQTALTNGALNYSRLGFRGTEDLGGGLAANFWLESGFLGDTGNATNPAGFSFNRRSTISLSGSFGEVRLGRDYTPTFWNDSVFDPMYNNGVGASLIEVANLAVNFGLPGSKLLGANANYVRASNSVGYFLPPNLGGFYGQVMYAFNEGVSYDPGALTPRPATADNARANRYVGGRFGYLSGQLDIAISYGSTNLASHFWQGSTTSLNILNVGASYDFGLVKLFGEYAQNRQKVDFAVEPLLKTPDAGFNGALLGFSIPVGPGLIRGAWSGIRYNNLDASFAGRDPKADLFTLGYIYNLSKRTALYGSVGYLKNKDGSALVVQGSPAFASGNSPLGGGALVPGKSTGFDLGMRHAF